MNSLSQQDTPSDGTWRVSLTKQRYKFSSAHMTIFPDGTKEALHGHNYNVGLNVEISDGSFAKMIDFSVLKKPCQELCEAWDEMVLLQNSNPYLTINENEDSLNVLACGKKYTLPKDECVILEIENISAELLAKEFTTRYIQKLRESGILDNDSYAKIRSIECTVHETAGQGVSYRCAL